MWQRAASAVLMVEESKDIGFNSPPTTWDRFFATYLENTFDEPQNHYHQTVDKLTKWVNYRPLYQHFHWLWALQQWTAEEPERNSNQCHKLCVLATRFYFQKIATWSLPAQCACAHRDSSRNAQIAAQIVFPQDFPTVSCPQTPNGDCDAILGMGKCLLCEAHRSFWRHEGNVYQQHYSPPTEFCRYL